MSHRLTASMTMTFSTSHSPSVFPHQPESSQRLQIVEPPLGPFSSLPVSAQGLASWKVLLVVTSVNSFAQRVLVYLQYLGFDNVSVQLATSDEAILEACESWDPDLVVCPFLTKRIEDKVFNRWITLVVHPGPPGDAGPSSLDWVLLGDDGSDADSITALSRLLTTPMSSWSSAQRSHWGTIVFQANEHLDGGAIWAWEQYPLPALGTITKAQLYQGLHSQAAIKALITAMIRVYQTAVQLPRSSRISAQPLKEWQERSVTLDSSFLGGKTHERPLLQSKTRRPDFSVHTAQDVLRIIYASDSQPGAQLSPLTTDSKTSLFAYGAHLHRDVEDVPTMLYTSRGWSTWSEIPDGSIVATRDGAVFFKTHRDGSSGSSAGIWITHARVPKKAGTPLEPKVPMTQAIMSSGHGKILEGVPEWKQEGFAEVEGTWQEVFVREVKEDKGSVMCVYWDFYNGACSTRQCKLLLEALQWAVSPEQGNVKVLALIGGTYFSNGIALNTIEASSSPSSPAHETWANICAIDDIVEFLLSDTSPERSPFMGRSTPLCERGIVTVACLRGNAAAGGVALAAACDVVLAGRGVVLNPAYRGMGLHGSEFHSYSYTTRCGPKQAGKMLRSMIPQSSTESRLTGLVDHEIGTATSSPAEIEAVCIDYLRDLIKAPASRAIPSAPWSACNSSMGGLSSPSMALTDFMCENKRHAYRYRSFPPLVHFRFEELSQMLLDSFHPTRSKRYHERRYRFIRKVKGDKTPARYSKHVQGGLPDEEDLASFDDAPGWNRGEEWAWVELETPASLATSEPTRVNLFPAEQHSRSAGEAVTLAPAISEVSAHRNDSIDTTSMDENSPSDSLASSEGTLPTTPSSPRRKTGINLLRKSPPTSPPSPRVITDASPSASPITGGKFRNFSRKFSSAFSTKSHKPRSSVPPSPPSPRGISNLDFGADGQPQVGKASISGPLFNPAMTYQQPKISGADDCEFPCLYGGPGGAGDKVVELTGSVLLPELGKYIEPRRAPVPPAMAAPTYVS